MKCTSINTHIKYKYVQMYICAALYIPALHVLPQPLLLIYLKVTEHILKDKVVHIRKCHTMKTSCGIYSQVRMVDVLVMRHFAS